LWDLRLTSPSSPPLRLCLLSHLVLVLPGYLLCCLSSNCRFATATLHCLSSPWLIVVSSLTPSSLITVVWPLLTLRHHLLFHLSWVSCPAGCCIASLLVGWMLHHLSSHRHLPSASNSASHPAVTSLHAPLHAIASRACSLAGCCIASPHAATSNLPTSPPLIAPLPLVAPWPPVPLVQLVVALPLLTPPPPICWQLCL
jgi:hypothetical protein